MTLIRRSPLAYRDVGKGREQDAEALRANSTMVVETDILIDIRPRTGSYNLLAG